MDETWMIFLSPENGLYPKNVARLAEDAGLRTKETCFGVLVEGEPGAVGRFMAGLKASYPVYVKKRAFSIEDTVICASTFRKQPEEQSFPLWLSRYAGQIRRYTS